MRVGSEYGGFRSRASLISSSDRGSGALDGDGQGDSGAGEDSVRGSGSVVTNPKVFFSTSSTKSSPPTMMTVSVSPCARGHRVATVVVVVAVVVVIWFGCDSGVEGKVLVVVVVAVVAVVVAVVGACGGGGCSGSRSSRTRWCCFAVMAVVVAA